MGGGGGGWSKDIGNIQDLMNKAKQQLKAGDAVKRNVFISFAMEDHDAVNLLRASAKNAKSTIEFNDWSVSEPYDSERAPYIRQKIAERIQHCSVTVVYLSDAAAKSRWVTWEIEESIRQGKHVIGVYSNAPTAFPLPIAVHKIKCVQWKELASTIDSLPD